MARINYSRVKYGSNGPPPRKCRFGPPALCQVTGFPTNVERLVRDDYGYMVDPRFGGGVDIDETKDAVARRGE